MLGLLIAHDATALHPLAVQLTACLCGALRLYLVSPSGQENKMAKKVHDIDSRTALSVARIVEEMENGASGELIAANCGNGQLNGDFFRKLRIFHSASKTKPAFTKTAQRTVRLITDEIASEVDTKLPRHSKHKEVEFKDS
ncbi:hypothetical protein QE400_002984 [Xanthomonas sacchari]|uniref:hypothetical protein n=1 Tax=Xanthomonas sacchari TaxID=56458 RepID=UPI002784691A|nr:hypothetical protein [Xanthomonas sacchari]MDQ1093571.1 hypothetical protein [Xanthomonas sacchari]